jgi:DNA-binding CsgD family transcriptional regulator
MVGTGVPQALEDEVVAFVRSNEPMYTKAIGRRFNITQNCMYRIVDKYNLPVKTRTFNQRGTIMFSEDGIEYVGTTEAVEFIKLNSHLGVQRLRKELNLPKRDFAKLIAQEGISIESLRHTTKIAFTDTQKDFMLSSYGNMTVTEIAKSVGVSPPLVSNYLKENGVEISQTRRVFDDAALAYVMANRHKSVPVLAEELGMNHSTVGKNLTLLGIVVDDESFCLVPTNLSFTHVTIEVDEYIKKNTHKTLWELNRSLRINLWVLYKFLLDNNVTLTRGIGPIDLDSSNVIRENIHLPFPLLSDMSGVGYNVIQQFAFINNLHGTGDFKNFTPVVREFIQANRGMPVEDMIEAIAEIYPTATYRSLYSMAKKIGVTLSWKYTA